MLNSWKRICSICSNRTRSKKVPKTHIPLDPTDDVAYMELTFISFNPFSSQSLFHGFAAYSRTDKLYATEPRLLKYKVRSTSITETLLTGGCYYSLVFPAKNIVLKHMTLANRK